MIPFLPIKNPYFALQNMALIICQESNCLLIFEGKEIHILGYGINPDYEPLRHHLDQFIQSRTVRNHKMLALLNAHSFKLHILN